MSEKKEYIARAQKFKNHSFHEFIQLAQDLLPEKLKKSPWTCDGLSHGTSILHTEDQLNSYLCAYASSHLHKVQHVIQEDGNIFKIIKILYSSNNGAYQQNFQENSIAQKTQILQKGYAKEAGLIQKTADFQIIDWGCGQGLATVAFFETCLDLMQNGYIRLDDKSNLFDHLRKVTLIDPSRGALERAELHVKHYAKDFNVKVESICQKLPLSHSSIEKIRSESDNVKLTINLYSNILDIPDIDLKILSRQSVLSNHTVNLCVGPCNARENRIFAFLCNFRPDYVNTIYQFRSVNFGHHKNNRPYTCNALLFSTERQNCPIKEIEFYTPAPKKAGYILDIFNDTYLASDFISKCEYDISSSYDIAAETINEINPIFAVLSNLITRGFPTKASPFLEQKLSSLYKITEESDDLESIIYSGDHNSIPDEVKNVLINTPIEVAQIQKTVIDSIISGHLILTNEWHILVYERDVPCAALAMEDLGEMFNHLSKLSAFFDDLKWPKISLHVISEKFADSLLHGNAKVYSNIADELRHTVFDIVIDISNTKEHLINQISFNEINVKEKSCYVIRNIKQSEHYKYCSKIRDYSHAIEPQHKILTSERIIYKAVTELGRDGRHIAIKENVEHLKYFLQLLFRKRDFRAGQLPIINQALRLRNVIGLLPTGAGKSITYQISALLQPGITVVIDPLVSLMKDQTENLNKQGIQHCVSINSKQTHSVKVRLQEQMADAHYQFAFLTPERLTIDEFRDTLYAMHEAEIYFSYGVIDEVHCVSEWGHDFRTAYLHLGRNIKEFLKPKLTVNGSHEQNRISLLGLTATASFDVLSDIERELSDVDSSLENESCIIRYENTNRLEMQYLILKSVPQFPQNKFSHYENKQTVLCELIKSSISSYLSECQTDENIRRMKENFVLRENLNQEERQKVSNMNISVAVGDNWYNEHEHAAIVFCPHSKGLLGPYSSKNSYSSKIGIADKIKETLDNNDMITTFTGASNSNSQTYADTDKNQDLFIKNESSIMVATKAFGMGIDKPNVRFTINVCHSGSLEAFVQESGRAGRDRKMALSVILYDPSKVENSNNSIDYNVHHFFHHNSFKGLKFEKAVIYLLMSKFEYSSPGVNDHLTNSNNSYGFMSYLDTLAIGDCFEFKLYYNNYNLSVINSFCVNHNISMTNSDNYKQGNIVQISQEEFSNVILKAIYRMCCVGIIDEYRHNYAERYLVIKSTRKSDDQYYECLKEYLSRYYAIERVKQEVELAKTYKGNTSYQKCLGYLSNFIYEKIAAKRLNAISDIETFCQIGISSKSHWLETNEVLKDFLFYYFNSKFARQNYVTPDNKPYSILDDTDRGKIANFDIIRKYMRVTDDTFFIDGTPKENIKHLQGAVRFMRRASAEPNPAMDLLNVYCIFYILREYDEILLNEMKDSFISGYIGFYRRATDYDIFYNEIDEFITQIEQVNHYALKNNEYNLNKLKLESELLIHSKWLANFSQNFSQ